MTIERWQEFPRGIQLAHIGSEVTRARVWREKHDKQASKQAIERALALIDLSTSDPNWQTGLSELTRLREVLCDNYNETQEYDLNLDELEKYCTALI